MLALPFALLTNALSGKSLGSYMGLFNCTICLPQIVASLVGGVLFMSFGGKDVYIDVPVKEEAKIEVVAESVAPESVAPETIETEIAGVANVLEAEITEAAELLNTIAETKVAEVTEVISEATEDTEVVAEATVEIKTERKKFQSGQIIMLVIAGISLLLGALAVFGINTRRKE
jgi:hypothetical protein